MRQIRDHTRFTVYKALFTNGYHLRVGHGQKRVDEPSSVSTLMFLASSLSSTALTETKCLSSRQARVHTDIECLHLSRWGGVRFRVSVVNGKSLSSIETGAPPVRWRVRRTNILNSLIPQLQIRYLQSKIFLYLLQQMTAQRSDIMTA